MGEGHCGLPRGRPAALGRRAAGGLGRPARRGGAGWCAGLGRRHGGRRYRRPVSAAASSWRACTGPSSRLRRHVAAGLRARRACPGRRSTPTGRSRGWRRRGGRHAGRGASGRRCASRVATQVPCVDHRRPWRRQDDAGEVDPAGAGGQAASTDRAPRRRPGGRRSGWRRPAGVEAMTLPPPVGERSRRTAGSRRDADEPAGVRPAWSIDEASNGRRVMLMHAPVSAPCRRDAALLLVGDVDQLALGRPRAGAQADVIGSGALCRSCG